MLLKRTAGFHLKTTQLQLSILTPPSPLLQNDSNIQCASNDNLGGGLGWIISREVDGERAETGSDDWIDKSLWFVALRAIGRAVPIGYTNSLRYRAIAKQPPECGEPNAKYISRPDGDWCPQCSVEAAPQC